MDKEQIREAAKVRKQRQRDNEKSHKVTQSPESVTNSQDSVTHVTDAKDYVTASFTDKTGEKAIIPEGVHIHRYVNGVREELTEVPEGFKVLSDGQVWKPIHPQELIEVEEPSTEHPIMKYLIPGKDRVKMEKIVQSLENHKQLGNVWFGCGDNPLSMDVVGEMLEVTGK